jgi:hypothetical protein
MRHTSRLLAKAASGTATMRWRENLASDDESSSTTQSSDKAMSQLTCARALDALVAKERQV